ncbi:MAG: hypothetical protein KKB20_30075 [Proteobacteria bacterium]|nr:hypothetical protein [Pseudomonadota bacterium]
MNPLAWDYQTWRVVFLIAALMNFVGAAGALWRPAQNIKLMYGLENSPDLLLFLNRWLWWIVLLFGIGYLLIAWEPARFPGIVIMGAVGKALFAANWIYLRAHGRATNLVLFPSAWDTVFALLFLIYLIGGPRLP